MTNLVVVDNPSRWPLDLPADRLISARQYLTEPAWSELRRAKVFNLCRSYRYQTAGYYVSLLATARGHKSLPSIATIQDLKSPAITRLMASDLDDLVQRSLRRLTSDHFTLSVYFGRNLAQRYEELSTRLFRLFPAPFLRAELRRGEDEWEVRSVRAIAGNDVPEAHRPFVLEAAQRFFSENRLPPRVRQTTQYDLAILHNPAERYPPSNPQALKKFAAAAKRLRVATEFIESPDYGRLAEFDALFIRETTNVNHHTYRFARRAAAERVAVIDDPDSIVRCGNKVFLAELLARNRVATPRTLIVHRENREQLVERIGLPCILKQPDSSFSQGVSKAATSEELKQLLDQLLEKSDLVIAQKFMPTDFDWRIGVLDRQPLYACKYFMARDHWQIQLSEGHTTRYGDVETLLVEDAPSAVVKTAVRAASLIGDGLYGVDIKDVRGNPVVIEVNDNPSIDARIEDERLGAALYERIMRAFISRIERIRTNGRGITA